MQIEAGKFYKTRDGRKVGPAADYDYDENRVSLGLPWLFRKSDGKYMVDGGRHESDLDVVSEWSDGPVREVTVTRREIVEGHYGGIYVVPDGPGRVTLGFDGHYVTFNAEQLAELEHLSAQLREALEDA